MEKILLIGGTGFIGKNMLQHIDAGLSQTQYVVLSRNPDIGSAHPNVKYVNGDFGDRQYLESLFRIEQFTKVFHFANSSVPVSSNSNIVGDIQDNLISTIILLDTMKKYHCDFLVYLSSGGAVYGEFTSDILDEDHPCKPISSYGITKWANEQYIQVYSRNYGVNYLIFRLSNPYGSYHESDHQGIINICIRRALKNQPVTIWGNGEQKKDYIFVQDVTSIIRQVVKMGIKNEIFNLGSGTSIDLNSILDKIRSFIPDLKIVYERSKPSDVKNFSLCIDKLRSVADINLTSFDTGLQKTIKWEKRKALVTTEDTFINR